MINQCALVDSVCKYEERVLQLNTSLWNASRPVPCRLLLHTVALIAAIRGPVQTVDVVGLVAAAAAADGGRACGPAAAAKWAMSPAASTHLDPVKGLTDVRHALASQVQPEGEDRAAVHVLHMQCNKIVR